MDYTNLLLGEYTSVIIDLGAKYLRMGYSGEDRPTVLIPSYVGLTGDGKKLFGEVSLASSMCVKIEPIITTLGISEELLESILDYAVGRLGLSWLHSPVLWIENPSIKSDQREIIAKLLFEKLKVPALYFCWSPVSTTFSQGRHTALVVDFGETSLRVCPVRDGMMLTPYCIFSEHLGGAMLRQQALALLQKQGIELHIYQQVLKKSATDLGKPTSFETNHLDTSNSFFKYHINSLLDDFKDNIIQVCENLTIDEKELAMRPTRYYEFPDGFNQSYGLERFLLGEYIFDPKRHLAEPLAEDAQVLGLADLIKKCLDQCGAEVRRDLQGNIILAGGGSSVLGLAERLSKELGGSSRVHAASSSIERRAGAWIGGSILASLSHFQTLWITLADYQEQGGKAFQRLP